MASFQNVISITESDTLYHLSDGYSNGTVDTDYWGDPLEVKNGRLVFQKKYVTFTFVINRTAKSDFQNPRDISINIEYDNGRKDANGNSIIETKYLCTDLDLKGNGDGILLYGSQSTDLTLPDKTAFIRAEVSTMKLYNVGRIRKIWCKIWYDDTNFIDGGNYNISQDFWLVGNSPNTTLYKGHKWTKGDWDTQVSTNRGSYNSLYCCPYPGIRSGNFSVYSKTSDGKTTDKFFTEEGGTFAIDCNAVQFCSTVGQDSYYRLPSHCFFSYTAKNGGTGVSKKDMFSTNEDLYSPGQNNSRQKTFNTVDFKEWKSINTIEICFGGDESNKITIFDKKILNIDLNENLPMSFTKESNRINYVSSVSKDKVDLYSYIKGSISRQDEGLIEFKSDFKLKPSLNSAGTEIKVEIKSDKININDTKTYSCGISDSDELDLSNRKFSTGDQLFSCFIKNKLRLSDSSPKEYVRNFSVTDLFLSAAEEIVALKGPVVSISYTNINKNSYEVPGLIIIKDEDLKFTKVDFEFYNIASGKKDESSYPYGIGLSTKTEYFQKKNENENIGDNVSTPYSVSYKDLKDNYKTNYGSVPDEQITLLLGYDFYNDKIYSYTFTYFLGRVLTNFQPKSYSVTPSKEIKYYLNDNGGDKTSSKTQNNFVDGRLNGQYFSLSRQPQSGNTAQERMKIKFSSPNPQKEKEITILINDNITLGLMLNLLKTHTTNQISLSTLGLLNDSDVAEITDLRNITIRISIEYLYGSGTSPYPREIIYFEMPNITFIPEDFPLGLRQNGVIINPSFDEKLNSNTAGEKKNTFVINVKNVEKNNDDKPIPTNGLKINFITGQNTSTIFEIFLDSDGQICFSNGEESFNAFETIEAFSKIKAIQKHLNLSDEQLENLLSS